MSIAQRIEAFVVDEIMIADSGTQLDHDENLLKNGVLDSLSLLRLISFVEESFNVHIEDEEIVPANFQSINKAVSFVEGKK